MLGCFPGLHEQAASEGIRNRCAIIRNVVVWPAAGMYYTLATKQAFHTLLTVLHDDVEVVIGHQVFNDPHCTLFIFILQ